METKSENTTKLEISKEEARPEDRLKSEDMEQQDEDEGETHEQFDFSSSDFDDVDDVFSENAHSKNIDKITLSDSHVSEEKSKFEMIHSTPESQRPHINDSLVNDAINISLINGHLIEGQIPDDSKTTDIDAENAEHDPICDSNISSRESFDDGNSNINNGNTTADHRSTDVDDDFRSDEDEVIVTFLGKANHIAEARLAQRRQARAEAREIRMRELERQQKEQEQNADRVFDMQSTSGIDPIARSRLAISSTSNIPIRGSSMSSRRSSEDSLEEEGRSLRDIRHELKDVEERFRKAMIANAQLDNERASQSYQIQLLKDKLEEMEESYAQLQREHKDKCRDHDALKRNNDKLMEELKLIQGQLSERDTLIAEQGLTIVIVENSDGTDARRALVSVENAQLLDTVQGSLDVRLKKFAEEKTSLKNEVQQLHQQLLEAKTKGRSGSMNGPLGDDDYEDAQREANKLIADYRYKLQKAEQEIASLQASLARSETQVIRYKSTADAAEKAESELKTERRKLQRENREVTERLEELETANNHLLKRLDKLKNAKSALLKDL